MRLPEAHCHTSLHSEATEPSRNAKTRGNTTRPTRKGLEKRQRKPPPYHQQGIGWGGAGGENVSTQTRKKIELRTCSTVYTLARWNEAKLHRRKKKHKNPPVLCPPPVGVSKLPRSSPARAEGGGVVARTKNKGTRAFTVVCHKSQSTNEWLDYPRQLLR